ncbi:uncharacterized protein EAF01_004572 [Botrytis porri]|uniref:uncharacterized protein n=1 Tax=Botrytis porri TaxID=87229 RepID=UPI001902182E|nr:uncharacterized protein EAF01_004572 [Botrytis porri]KAF7906985.1 hypothetical protein EAF01_004572 [Botrytis porri]
MPFRVAIPSPGSVDRVQPSISPEIPPIASTTGPARIPTTPLAMTRCATKVMGCVDAKLSILLSTILTLYNGPDVITPFFCSDFSSKS